MSAAEQIFGAGGKRMRPALVFLVSRATAELIGLKCVISHILSQNSLSYICWINVSLLYHRELTMQHRRLAEIIEMIHTASLIHDDVLDDSDIRRGRILHPFVKITSYSSECQSITNLNTCNQIWDRFEIPTRICIPCSQALPWF